ncbi:MAG: HAMP domain-containing histidine kinase [Acidimicrobiia bacterium]|nr:HAMP domain-containing histidine kinase [Acidimicrobiia bacterium]
MASNLTRIWDGITASGLEGRSPEASVFARQLNGFVAAGGLFVLLASIPIAFGRVGEAAPVAAGFGVFALAFVFLVRFVPDRYLRLCGHVAGGAGVCAVGLALWIENPHALLNGFWWLALVILPIVHLLGRVAGVGWTTVAVTILGLVTIKDVRATDIASGEAVAGYLSEVAFLIGVLAVGSFVRTLSVRQIAELDRQRGTIRRQRAELDSIRVRTDAVGSNARTAAAQLEAALGDRREAENARAKLLAAVGHEIRDPVNAVLASCAHLLEGDLTAEQQELAYAISETVSALHASVGGLVDLARLAAETNELEALSFRVDEVLPQVAARVATQRGLGPGEISTSCGEGIDLDVVGDATRLAGVLEALAAFSIEMNPGCGVRIHAARVAADTVRFEVASTPLFPVQAEAIAAVLSKMDEPEADPGWAGVTIGLTRDLVRQMGGRLTTKLDAEAFHTYFRVPLAPQGDPSSDRENVLPDTEIQR